MVVSGAISRKGVVTAWWLPLRRSNVASGLKQIFEIIHCRLLGETKTVGGDFVVQLWLAQLGSVEPEQKPWSVLLLSYPHR